MSELMDIASVLRDRPGTYLGGKSLVKLKSFLDGYNCAMQKYTQRDTALDEFPDWVRDRLECSVPRSWEHVIGFYTTSELEAWEYFWKLFDEYVEHKKDTDTAAGRTETGTPA